MQNDKIQSITTDLSSGLTLANNIILMRRPHKHFDLTLIPNNFKYILLT